MRVTINKCDLLKLIRFCKAKDRFSILVLFLKKADYQIEKKMFYITILLCHLGYRPERKDYGLTVDGEMKIQT